MIHLKYFLYMSVKRMFKRVTVYTLVSVLFWQVNIATNDIGKQECSRISGRNEYNQKKVLSITETCELLNTVQLERENPDWKPEIITVGHILISMDEISTKEESFDNKVVPHRELLNDREAEVVFQGILVANIRSDEESNPEQKVDIVIKNKHIRALNKFLLMFEGSKIEMLEIHEEQVTKNKEELQQIRETIRTSSRVRLSINIKCL